MRTLPDIQEERDHRGLDIACVGVTGVRMPVRLLRRTDDERLNPTTGPTMDTVGEFELSTFLSKEVKGTHMSRFTEVLQSHIDHGGIFSHADLMLVTKELRNRLISPYVKVRLVCDYFVLQPSPETKRKGVAPLKGILEAECLKDGNILLATGVEMEGQTCCPCSRLISDFDPEIGKGRGSHAQRSHVSVLLRHSPVRMIWFEELVEIIWKAYSSPVYPVLKRLDERAVTIQAYDHAKFVEDVIRDVIVGLHTLSLKGAHYTVRVQNAESIHYHDAFASDTGTLL